ISLPGQYHRRQCRCVGESLAAAHGRRQWRRRGRRATAAGAFPKAFAWVRGRNQLFSSDLILLSNSSNEVSPLIISPLMKKVGVEPTFKTSFANFWSAAILSSSA